MINYEILENLLKSKWSSVLNMREIINYATEQAQIHLGLPIDHKITRLSITRFELTEKGFLLWLEYNLTNYQNNCKGITEALLHFNGKMSHIITQTTE